MRIRMSSITIVVLVTVAVLLVAGSIAAGAVPAPPVEMPPPPYFAELPYKASVIDFSPPIVFPVILMPSQDRM